MGIRTVKLIPKNRDVGWAPYVWLAYLLFFLIPPFVEHYTSKGWLATGIGLVAFLTCYFGYFRMRRPLYAIAGMIVLRAIYMPFNGGASGFFIYAASMCPFVLQDELSAAKVIAGILALIGLEAWLLPMSRETVFMAAFLSLFIGAGNIYFAQRSRAQARLKLAQDEIEHLAKTAERERIARDLHDLLGHTLSLIVLKTELVARLLERDPTRAQSEIRDVERTAREALAEVRQTILGYRIPALKEELSNARTALQTAGMSLDCDAPELSLPPTEEGVLALVLREAVTNVVRHSGARHCHIRLQQDSGNYRLEVHDDGSGGHAVEGNGLRGMRERIEALGGTLERATRRGTRIVVTLPVSGMQELVSP